MHGYDIQLTNLPSVPLAVVLGALLTRWWGGGLARWPIATLLMLWPAFGGHWVELGFLNWLRPRIAASRGVQAGARIAAWFVGGTLLSLGMVLTAMAVSGLQPARWPAVWIGGFAFIGIELVAHIGLQLRGAPNVYNGRG